MAWSSFTTMVAGNSKTSTSTLDVTIGATGAAAGAFVMVAIATDNLQTTDVTDGTDISGVSDSKGNVYFRAKTFTNGQGSAGAGATAGLYYSILTTALVTNDIVTINFGSAVTAKAASIARASFDSGMVAIVGSNTQAADGADLGAITISSLPSREYLWVHCVAHEGVNTDSYTEDADYSSFNASGTTGGSTANMSIRGGVRIFTGTTDTVDVTYTAVDHAQVYVAFQEITAAETSPDDESLSVVRSRASYVRTRAAAFMAALPLIAAPPTIQSSSTTLSTDQWGATFSAASTPQPQASTGRPQYARYQVRNGIYSVTPLTVPGAPDSNPTASQPKVPARAPWRGRISADGPFVQAASSTLSTDQWGATFTPVSSVFQSGATDPPVPGRVAARPRGASFEPMVMPPMPPQPMASEPRVPARATYPGPRPKSFWPGDPPAAAPAAPDWFDAPIARPTYRYKRVWPISGPSGGLQPGVAPDYPKTSLCRPLRAPWRPRGGSVGPLPDVAVVPPLPALSESVVVRSPIRKRSMGQFSCSIAPVKSPTLDVTIQSTAHIVEPPGEKVRTIASTAFIVRRRPISNVADLFAPVRTRFVVEGPSKRTDPEPT